VTILSVFAATAALWDIQQVIRDAVVRNEQNRYSGEAVKHKVQLHNGNAASFISQQIPTPTVILLS
jgi:hypothetical protein